MMRKIILMAFVFVVSVAKLAFAQGYGNLYIDKARQIKTDVSAFVGYPGGILTASDVNVQLALQSLNASPVSILTTTAADGDSTTTQSNSGMEFINGRLTFLRGCADDQILKWDETQDDWNCEDDGGGAGSSAYSSITAPTSNHAIVFGTFTSVWTSTATNGTDFFRIHGGDLEIGNGTFTNTSSAEDAYVEGNLEVDGLIYGDGTNITGITASAAWNTITNPTGNQTLNMGIYANSWTSANVSFTNNWTSAATTKDFFSIDTQALTTGNAIEIDVGHVQTTGVAISVQQDGTETFSVTGPGVVNAASFNLTGTGTSIFPDGVTVNNDQEGATANNLTVYGDTGFLLKTNSSTMTVEAWGGWKFFDAITFENFESCTALETSSTGVLTCGSDDSGSGSGSTVYNDIGDATNNGGILFSTFTSTWTSAATTGDFFTVEGTAQTTGDLLNINTPVTATTGDTIEINRAGTKVFGVDSFGTLSPSSYAGTMTNQSGINFGAFNNSWTYTTGTQRFGWGNTNSWTSTSTTNLWTAAASTGEFFVVANGNGPIFAVNHNQSITVGDGSDDSSIRFGNTVTADPCASGTAAYGAGTMYYSSGGFFCYCNATDDLKFVDASACTY